MTNLLSFASVMRSIGGVLLAILILLAMVTVHEFGHYIAGKILHFKINEFSVGFGPAIFKKRSKKTGELFALRVIPLGGYCAFDGEDEEETAEEEKKEAPFSEYAQEPTTEENEGGRVASNEEYPQPQGERFNDQPPWKRIIVLLAGATMNYLLALLLILLAFTCIGRPVYSVVAPPESWQPSKPPLVENTLPEEERLRTGDLILKIDGKSAYLITDYMDALKGKKAGEVVELTVVRDGEERIAKIMLAQNADFVNLSDTYSLLYAMDIYGLTTQSVRQGFFSNIGHSFAYSVKIGGTVLRSLGELLTGKLGLDAMGGPITTIQITSQAASAGVASFLNIAAFIGVNLAVFNLLPIPALDGSKVVFCIIEWIRKKPVNRKVEAMIHFIGLLLIFGFAILVDLLQLF